MLQLTDASIVSIFAFIANNSCTGNIKTLLNSHDIDRLMNMRLGQTITIKTHKVKYIA